MANLPRNDKKTAPGSSTMLHHPPYFQMIREALTSLKDRNGSSQPAIAKFLEDKYTKQLPPNYKKILSVQLKKFVKSQKLIKVKNSYKISPAEKEPKSVKKKGTSGAGNDEKAGKIKKLSQVKTPEALKMKKKKKGSVTARRMKRLSQINTPEALKKKRKAAALPVEMKLTSKSTRPRLPRPEC